MAVCGKLRTVFANCCSNDLTVSWDGFYCVLLGPEVWELLSQVVPAPCSSGNVTLGGEFQVTRVYHIFWG